MEVRILCINTHGGLGGEVGFQDAWETEHGSLYGFRKGWETSPCGAPGLFLHCWSVS